MYELPVPFHSYPPPGPPFSITFRQLTGFPLTGKIIHNLSKNVGVYLICRRRRHGPVAGVVIHLLVFSSATKHARTLFVTYGQRDMRLQLFLTTGESGQKTRRVGRGGCVLRGRSAPATRFSQSSPAVSGPPSRSRPSDRPRLSLPFCQACLASVSHQRASACPLYRKSL